MIDNKSNYRALGLSDAARMLFDREQILIIFHINPDGDATGSAFALKCALEAIGKRAFCVCAAEVPDRLRFIVDDSQQGVSLNDMTEEFVPDLVVSVDTASPSQMGSLYDVYNGKVDLMIDHHEKGTPYADNYIVASASSCGEVLYGVIQELFALCGKTENDIPFRACELIYTAISSDTGCFRYSNVKPETHALASRLIERGIDAADINHKLFGIKTLKQMQVEHAGFERMNFHCDGRIAVITFPYDLKSQYGADDEHLETLIDVARCVKGVEVAAVIKQPTKENRFRVSMRSSCDFDVSEICAYYGGGGHARAAGCTIVSDSILSAEMSIVVAIEHQMQDGKDKSE